jgi:hypothetical protein
MRSIMDRFSVAMYGDSQTFGWISVDCMDLFPNVTIYDRGDRFRAFVRSEIRLGFSKYASPEVRRSARRTQYVQGHPQPVDIKIICKQIDQTDFIVVEGRVTRDTLAVDFNLLDDLDQVQSFVDKVLVAIKKAQ